MKKKFSIVILVSLVLITGINILYVCGNKFCEVKKTSNITKNDYTSDFDSVIHTRRETLNPYEWTYLPLGNVSNRDVINIKFNTTSPANITVYAIHDENLESHINPHPNPFYVGEAYIISGVNYSQWDYTYRREDFTGEGWVHHWHPIMFNGYDLIFLNRDSVSTFIDIEITIKYLKIDVIWSDLFEREYIYLDEDNYDEYNDPFEFSSGHYLLISRLSYNLEINESLIFDTDQFQVVVSIFNESGFDIVNRDYMWDTAEYVIPYEYRNYGSYQDDYYILQDFHVWNKGNYDIYIEIYFRDYLNPDYIIEYNNVYLLGIQDNWDFLEQNRNLITGTLILSILNSFFIAIGFFADILGIRSYIDDKARERRRKRKSSRTSNQLSEENKLEKDENIVSTDSAASANQERNDNTEGQELDDDLDEKGGGGKEERTVPGDKQKEKKDKK